MTSISSIPTAAFGSLATLANSSRNQAADAAVSPGSFSVQPSSSVTFGTADDVALVYDRPTAPVLTRESALPSERVWDSPARDQVSRLMERNVGAAAGPLADQWKGIGGALLTRFKTAQDDFAQTVVDHDARVSDTQAMDVVKAGPTRVELTVRMRSGQSVELTITSSGASGIRGLHAEVHSSGSLTSTERDALAALADGFEKALKTLGQPLKPQLDLSDLLQYDASVIKGLGLEIGSSRATDAMKAFVLHSDDARRSITMTSTVGKVAVEVDLDSPPGSAGSAQESAAIDAYLAQFDAAADRSHADTDLITLFKSAFMQAHANTDQSVQTRAATNSDMDDARTRPLLSGLHDFKASFDGDFSNGKGFSRLTEAGHAHYDVAQETTVERHPATGKTTTRQVRSAQLDAVMERSRGATTLEIGTGNYDVHRVKDRTVSTTAVVTGRERLESAVGDTVSQQLLEYQKLVKHRVTDSRRTPHTAITHRNLS